MAAAQEHLATDPRNENTEELTFRLFPHVRQNLEDQREVKKSRLKQSKIGTGSHTRRGSTVGD